MVTEQWSGYEAFRWRVSASVEVAAAGFMDGGVELASSYRYAIRFVFGILGTFVLESRNLGDASVTSGKLRAAADGELSWKSAQAALSSFAKATRIELIKSAARLELPAESARQVLQVLFAREQDVVPGLELPEVIPSSWLSSLYENLLELTPKLSSDQSCIKLEPDPAGRKKSGSFFTPSYIIDYILSKTIGKQDKPKLPRILDPSMGAGDFLVKALRFLIETGGDAVNIAENCLFGCDIDPAAVDIARFLVWLETDGQADSERIAEHLICADALSGEDSFRWQEAFPDVFRLFPEGPGFDAVIGNPPYIAAKNGAIGDGKKAAHSIRGQSDYYLLFLDSLIKNGLVRSGGSLGMVLPDPFLVRENAAHIREVLLRNWTIESVVHISGAFPSAQVANIVLICSNSGLMGGSFPVVRLDKAGLRQSFEAHPEKTVEKLAHFVNPEFALAQPKAEVLYLTDGFREKPFQRIHGQRMSLSDMLPPFIPLKDIDVEVIFRGEEIGKRAIERSEGDLPILLGGQSIKPFQIIWEGKRIAKKDITKPLNRYLCEKLLLQKSSPRLVAAFDRTGYVIPQSVYGIKLASGCPYDPFYLLALLNSDFLSDYVFRMFTGYKLVQPQIELEDVKRLPVRSISFNMEPDERAFLAGQGKNVFEKELELKAGEFQNTEALVWTWLQEGKDEAVHDLLVYLARSRQDEKMAFFAERVDSIINAVVNLLYEN